MKKRILSVMILSAMILSLYGCSADSAQSSDGDTSTTDSAVSSAESVSEVSEEQRKIESMLNLANNTEVTWSYNSDNDAWVMSVVSAVAYPELVDYQGVSVAVPGAYVTGIDTDGDGTEDITSESYSQAVNGTLVIDSTASITSENGQVYTAATAPVIINTGAAGYSSQQN